MVNELNYLLDYPLPFNSLSIAAFVRCSFNCRHRLILTLIISVIERKNGCSLYTNSSSLFVVIVLKTSCCFCWTNARGQRTLNNEKKQIENELNEWLIDTTLRIVEFLLYVTTFLTSFTLRWTRATIQSYKYQTTIQLSPPICASLYFVIHSLNVRSQEVCNLFPVSKWNSRESKRQKIVKRKRSCD